MRDTTIWGEISDMPHNACNDPKFGGNLTSFFVDGRTIKCKPAYTFLFLSNKWASCPEQKSSCRMKDGAAQKTDQLSGVLQIKYADEKLGQVGRLRIKLRLLRSWDRTVQHLQQTF